MRHLLKFSLAIAAVILLIMTSSSAFADEGGGSASKTPPSRWSLDEWLKQKQRNRLMDQWLSIHESSPYEFFVGADGMSISATSDATGSNQQVVNNAYRASVGAYATNVGLEGVYENLTDLNSKSAEGSFHVRLLGTSVRSTSLDAHYAIKNRDENGDDHQQPFQPLSQDDAAGVEGGGRRADAALEQGGGLAERIVHAGVAGLQFVGRCVAVEQDFHSGVIHPVE